MMKCPKCQFENPDGMKFCGECGAKIEMLCPNCGFSNPPQFKFCGECGQALSKPLKSNIKDFSFEEKLAKIQRYLPKGLTEKILSQRDRIEGERKQVTVMFCDMEGFTSLSEKVGSEEAYNLMDQVYEILIHKVHDFEGTVNEMTGDGIVALFGAPIALEDAPQRAIRSAMAIHREIVKFSDLGKRQGLSKPIKMRIGIHTGSVVVGTVGNDLRVEFKAVGDTVNLASRIEKIAEPGTTYVTKDTFKLTEGLFRFEALGNREIKGKEKPERIYRVLAPSTRRTRFDVSSEQGLTPLVGRERELELLLDGFERAKFGRGQAFSIIAEAGLGKSRLLYEFRKAIANQNITFLEGKCLSYSRNVPYHPVIDILKSSFRIRESDNDTDIIHKIKKGLKIIGVDEASTFPYLFDLLSVKDSDFDQVHSSPDEKRLRIIEALNRIVLKSSDIRPIVMAVEDLHWIDKSSEERFKSLLENIPGARVCLIFTYRPEFVHTWGGRSYHSQVTLNRLSNRESLRIVYHLLGTEKIKNDLEDMILDKTEGVPFFIEEFVRSIKDLDIIEKKDNTYHLTGNYEILTIPSRIQDVMMARVDLFSDGVKEILQIGSVIGREFDHKLLKEITELSEHELLSKISILKDSELIYERGIYPQSTYVFKHALTQDAVYQSLLKNTRKKIHRIIAEKFEQSFQEIAVTQPELLSYHFTEAGLAARAIPYCQQAGEKAIRRSANKEAIDHLTRGLELLKALPETYERNQNELMLLLAIGPPLIAIEGPAFPELETIYLKALELCEKTSDNLHNFWALRALCNLYNNRAEYKTAMKYAEDLMKLAQKEQNALYYQLAHRSLGPMLLWVGELKSAQWHFEQVIDMYSAQQNQTTAFSPGADPVVHSYAFTSLILWLLGYPEKALERSQESLVLAYKLNHPFTIAGALNLASGFFHCCGDFRKAENLDNKLIELSSKQGFKHWLAFAAIRHDFVEAMEGDEEETIIKLLKSISELKILGIKQTRTFVLTRLAQVYAKYGKTTDGLQTLEEAEHTLFDTKERFCEAEIYRLKGELLLAQSADMENEAESCFQKALKVANQQHSKSFELRAAVSLSRLWQSQGKKEEARNLLSKIYGWFKEGFDTVDLKDAKALLEELS